MRKYDPAIKINSTRYLLPPSLKTILGLALILSSCLVLRAAQAPGPATTSHDETSDSLRNELEGLREEVRALRSELRTLKSAFSAAQAGALSEEPAASARVQQRAKAGETTSAAPSSVGEPKMSSSSALAASKSAQLAKSALAKVLGERVTLGGYGSMRFEANNVSPGHFLPGGSANGFTFRRFVLTTDARLTPRLRIHSETEFERLLEIEVEKSVRRSAGGLNFRHETEGNSGGEISLEQIWGQYDLAENHGLRFGVVLPPLGRFNTLHDDDYWDLPRRTLVDRDAPVVPVPVAWRELGAGLVGSFTLPRSAKLGYEFYVLNGSVLDFNPEISVATRAGDTTKLEVESEMKLAAGAFDGTQGARALAWRAALSPTLAGEIALSGYHGNYASSFLSVKEPINALGLDWKWRRRAFQVEGEFIYTSLGRVRRVLENLAAVGLTSSSEAETGDVETEIELGTKGLARTRYGFWTDFKYHWRPPFLRRSFLGRDFEDPQLIPIARYERVWLNRHLNGFSFAEGRITSLEQEDLSQDRLSLGINYRPVSQFGLQLAYEHNQRRGGSRLIFPAVPDRSTDGVLAGMTFAF